jgi:DNA polymerase-1
MGTWLLVDCNGLCHRALHTTGGLSHNGQSTGVSFGLFRDLENLRDSFGPERTVLAFDGPGSLRQQVYPGYKATRRNREFTPEEKKIREEFYEEMRRLHGELLPVAGFRNVLLSAGYEADDIIAKICQNLPPSVDAVIVSSDADLMQCLAYNVVIYRPHTKKVVTAESFTEEWGIPPKYWPHVKAYAGCSSDDIQGLFGVGEKTAARFLAGTLPPGKKRDQLVAGQGIFNFNLPLVELPYPGLVLPEIVPDEVTQVRLNAVRTRLGIRGKSREEVAEAYPGLEL